MSLRSSSPGARKSLSVSPEATISPPSRMMTLLQIIFTTSIWCVTTTIVTLSFLLISISSSSIEIVVLGSRAEVASSQSSISGFSASALAMPTRCFCPPLRLRTFSCLFPVRPTSSSSSFTLDSASFLGVPHTLRGKRMFSKTSFLFMRLKFWKIIPMSRRSSFSSFSSRSLTSLPPTRTLPSV